MPIHASRIQVCLGSDCLANRLYQMARKRALISCHASTPLLDHHPLWPGQSKTLNVKGHHKRLEGLQKRRDL